MELVGYRTFCEEIRNLFHEVRLLRRPPGLLSYGLEWMRKVTNDILFLSSLRSCLGQRKGPTEPEQGQRGSQHSPHGPVNRLSLTPRSEEGSSKALQEAKEAYQQALEAACMLE